MAKANLPSRHEASGLVLGQLHSSASAWIGDIHLTHITILETVDGA
jgi:hypothetical protein